MKEACSRTIYETPRKEYVEDLYYRVVQLLFRYKNIARVESVLLLNDVLGWKMDCPEAEVYAGLISSGNVELKESEINAFANYIAHALGYDTKSFLEAVKYRALYYEPSNDERTNLRR